MFLHFVGCSAQRLCAAIRCSFNNFDTDNYIKQFESMKYFFDLRPFVRGVRGEIVLLVRAGFARELAARSVGSSHLLPTVDCLVLLEGLVTQGVEFEIMMRFVYM